MTRHWLVMETGEGGEAPFVARVAGAGRHLPGTRLTTDELMASTRHHTHIDLERLTGIRERRISAGTRTPSRWPPRRQWTVSRARNRTRLRWTWSSAAASRSFAAA